MRTQAEIELGIKVLGTSLGSGNLRRHVYGAMQNVDTSIAWMCFCCLGWMAGLEDNAYTRFLHRVEMKLLTYAESQEETTNGKR